MEDWKKRWEDFKEKTIFDTRVDTDDNYPEEYNVYLSEYDTTAIENFIFQELSKAREEGCRKGKEYQARLDREIYGMSFEEFDKKWKPVSKLKDNK